MNYISNVERQTTHFMSKKYDFFKKNSTYKCLKDAQSFVCSFTNGKILIYKYLIDFPTWISVCCGLLIGFCSVYAVVAVCCCKKDCGKGEDKIHDEEETDSEADSPPSISQTKKLVVRSFSRENSVKPM